MWCLLALFLVAELHPVRVVDDVQEQLMYAVQDDAIIFGWEKARLRIPVE